MRPVPYTDTTGTAGFGPSPVWSSGDTTTETFHPLSDLYAGAEVSLVRASLELQHSSGDIELRVAVRYSDTAADDDWTDDPVAFGPAFTSTEGATYGTEFVNVGELTGITRKAYAQFGVVAKNASSAPADSIEMTRACIRLDFVCE